mmetsp:Transcript_124559/g.346817  ORF Transcript_124559/g.346817 Transcript_124559/m.346817 type:complete len:223 (-) Transcript_124559:76-744(-)
MRAASASRVSPDASATCTALSTSAGVAASRSSADARASQVALLSVAPGGIARQRPQQAARSALAASVRSRASAVAAGAAAASALRLAGLPRSRGALPGARGRSRASLAGSPCPQNRRAARASCEPGRKSIQPKMKTIIRMSMSTKSLRIPLGQGDSGLSSSTPLHATLSASVVTEGILATLADRQRTRARGVDPPAACWVALLRRGSKRAGPTVETRYGVKA